MYSLITPPLPPIDVPKFGSKNRRKNTIFIIMIKTATIILIARHLIQQNLGITLKHKFVTGRMNVRIAVGDESRR